MRAGDSSLGVVGSGWMPGGELAQLANSSSRPNPASRLAQMWVLCMRLVIMADSRAQVAYPYARFP